MLNNTEYHNAEMSAVHRQIAQLAALPLGERKEAEDDAYVLMTHPTIAGARVQWVLAGNYGYGAQQHMCKIAADKRGNRPAQAMQLLAALECSCPAGHTIKAWKRLTDGEKAKLDAALLDVLNTYKEGE